MAKGGARKGAGRKPSSLSQKLSMTHGHRPVTIVAFDGGGSGGERPPPPDYLRMTVRSRNNYPSAVDFFNRMVDWLETTGCLHMIPPDMIAEYALAKFFMIETAYGLSHIAVVAKPEKGEPIVTPYAKGFFECAKVASEMWQIIWEIVAHNSTKFLQDPEKELISEMFGGRRRGRGRPPKIKEDAAHGIFRASEDSDFESESGEI